MYLGSAEARVYGGVLSSWAACAQVSVHLKFHLRKLGLLEKEFVSVS
jgi:hypothetical protein